MQINKALAFLTGMMFLLFTAGMMLFTNPIQPFCPIAPANAQDGESLCLSSEATLSAQSLRIMELEGTVVAFESELSHRHTVGLIGYWELVEVVNPVKYYFRNDGFVQIDAGASDSTGVYAVHGNTISMVMASTASDQPITADLKILEMNSNQLIFDLERGGSNLTFTAQRITADQFWQVETAPNTLPVPTPTPDSIIMFESLTADDVTRFAITNNSNDEFLRIISLPGGGWQVDGASSYSRSAETNQELVQGVVRTFARLRALESYQPDSLDVFGLDDPVYVMAVLNSDDNIFLVRIGSRNSAETGYYVTINDDEETVYLLPEEVIEAFVGLIERPPYVRESNGED